MIANRWIQTLVLASALPAASLTAQGTDAFARLESASAVYRGAPAICAEFDQTLSVPLLGQDVKGRGKVCTKQPGLFSMRFSEPKGDVLLADGTFLWRYTPSTDPKQVLKIPMAGGPVGVDFYREFLDAPRGKYEAKIEARETVDGRPTQRIALTPVRRTSYKSARVWIDDADALLRKVEITEENGSVRSVVLRAVDLKPALAADAFRFTPPAGAQVIAR